MHITLSSQCFRERGREDLGVDGRTLNWIFKETGLIGVDWINLTQNRGDGGLM
jgi:hypothetical protein